ncbi:hypothetical protein AF332_11210 [Sporosarcina globispora]|uniref:Uncharacterized protein n=1 Tax=Sporosarcina globispora TaxID=1459 RepID=A0A0M0GCR9_SPOGL|nr:hypothetical protein [Sporosarcina globispora]KON87337.1 hypothetical protein AF332_11210 [Sporosarcina globispora]
MAKKQNTEIKFTQMKKAAKQYHSQEQYEFEDGTTLKFYPIFPPTLIEEMIKEISTVLSAEGDELKISEDMLHKYTLFMMIKHFTHLKSQLKGKSLAEQLNELNAVIDSGYFTKIIDEVFIPAEVQKAFDQMAKISGNVAYLQKMTEKMHDEVAKLELKNGDIFKNLDLNKDRKQIPEV